MDTRKSTGEEFRVAFDYLRTINKTELKLVADACGCSKRHIQGILSEKERKGVSRAFAVGISNFFNLDYEDFISLGRWILKGKNPEWWPRPLPSLAPDSLRNAIADPRRLPGQQSFISVRKASTKLIDNKTFVFEEGLKDIYHFRREWLSNFCQQPAIAVLFEVEGASMEPTLKDKDTVIVDVEAVDLHSDKIYALGISGTVSFKRLNIRVSGEVEVITDNPDKTRYPNEVVNPDQISIVGQVVWRGGRI